MVAQSMIDCRFESYCSETLFFIPNFRIATITRMDLKFKIDLLPEPEKKLDLDQMQVIRKLLEPYKQVILLLHQLHLYLSSVPLLAVSVKNRGRRREERDGLIDQREKVRTFP